MKKLYLSLIAISSFSLGLQAQTQEVSIAPVKDNSIFSEGELSNGAGEQLFAGTIRTGGHFRRAFIAFDPTSAVPEGTQVDSVKLLLEVTKQKGSEVYLHALLKDWGEGSSKASGPEGKGVAATDDDVTWSMTQKTGGVAWSSPGGDFEAAPSASTTASLGSKTVFMSEAMTDDVNYWLANPADNFGWIVLGDETQTTTAIRFASRENTNEDQRPQLVLYYQEEAVSISNPSLPDTEWLVYVHAQSNALHVTGPKKVQELSLELYSITGAKILDQIQSSGASESIFQLPDTQSGIYIYRIRSGQWSQSGKIIL